jgi:hypothetical protein
MEETKTYELAFYLLNGGRVRQEREGSLKDVAAFVSSVKDDVLTLTDAPTSTRPGKITFIPYHSISSIEITEKVSK